jgi:hypothetical protein
MKNSNSILSMPCLALLAALALPANAAPDKAVSLAGEWRFEIAGTNADAYARTLPGKIHLPGTMDDAGLGPRNTKPPTLAVSTRD